MATKAVKILDKNFHISLKLNDLPISVAVGISRHSGSGDVDAEKVVADTGDHLCSAEENHEQRDDLEDSIAPLRDRLG